MLRHLERLLETLLLHRFGRLNTAHHFLVVHGCVDWISGQVDRRLDNLSCLYRLLQIIHVRVAGFQTNVRYHETSWVLLVWHILWLRLLMLLLLIEIL